MAALQCYNKGCGLAFDPAKNSKDSCIHHPGVPVFHDALKGWSCCKKRSTDFTEFLNIPGCTKGLHSNEKAVDAVKPEVQSGEEKPGVPEQQVEAPPQIRQPLEKQEVLERPAVDTEKINLRVTVGQTLVQALEKQMKEVNLEKDEKESELDEVKEGTSCKNNGCTTCYQDESTNLLKCIYHPGVPIFHEGMKYWTCCKRKTSDFDNFLNQEGCSSGSHVWIKKKDTQEVVAACRYDWHQTAGSVIISVFSKVAIPDKSWVKVNPVAISIHITFDAGSSVFKKDLILEGVIDPAKSSVKMLGTKVEITLKKAEPGKWTSLELKTAAESVYSDS